MLRREKARLEKALSKVEKEVDNYLKSSFSNERKYLETNIKVALWFIINNIYEILNTPMSS